MALQVSIWTVYFGHRVYISWWVHLMEWVYLFATYIRTDPNKSLKINGKLKQTRCMNQKLMRMCCKLPYIKQKEMFRSLNVSSINFFILIMHGWNKVNHVLKGQLSNLKLWFLCACFIIDEHYMRVKVYIIKIKCVDTLFLRYVDNLL